MMSAISDLSSSVGRFCCLRSHESSVSGGHSAEGAWGFGSFDRFMFFPEFAEDFLSDVAGIVAVADNSHCCCEGYVVAREDKRFKTRSVHLVRKISGFL